MKDWREYGYENERNNMNHIKNDKNYNQTKTESWKQEFLKEIKRKSNDELYSMYINISDKLEDDTFESKNEIKDKMINLKNISTIAIICISTFLIFKFSHIDLAFGLLAAGGGYHLNKYINKNVITFKNVRNMMFRKTRIKKRLLASEMVSRNMHKDKRYPAKRERNFLTTEEIGRFIDESSREEGIEGIFNRNNATFKPKPPKPNPPLYSKTTVVHNNETQKLLQKSDGIVRPETNETQQKNDGIVRPEKTEEPPITKEDVKVVYQDKQPPKRLQLYSSPPAMGAKTLDDPLHLFKSGTVSSIRNKTEMEPIAPTTKGTNKDDDKIIRAINKIFENESDDTKKPKTR